MFRYITHPFATNFGASPKARSTCMCKAYRQRSIWARIKLFSLIPVLILSNRSYSKWIIDMIHFDFVQVTTIFLKLFPSPESYGNFPKNQVPTLVGCLFYLLKNGWLGCGDRIWTYDLRVMSPTSYRAAPPRVSEVEQYIKANSLRQILLCKFIKWTNSKSPSRNEQPYIKTAYKALKHRDKIPRKWIVTFKKLYSLYSPYYSAYHRSFTHMLMVTTTLGIRTSSILTHLRGAAMRKTRTVKPFQRNALIGFVRAARMIIPRLAPHSAELILA